MSTTTHDDEKYMRRALQLARGGREHAAPNPMVGAVVVDADGRIIGEGYHRRCGGPHAEVNAIRQMQTPTQPSPTGEGVSLSALTNGEGNDKAPSPTGEGRGGVLDGCTIYVTLEPCAHYGRTPPCAQLIIDTGIPRVVVGCRDPFAKVDGLGIKMLRNAGCEVVVGCLEEECLALNRRFMTFHSKKRPFVTLKWAQSADGYIDRLREPGDGQTAMQFSTPHTQQICHRRRAEHDAILVGYRTALLDDPSLTTRLWPGRNPLRVVLDRDGSLPRTLRLFTDNEAETLVLHDTRPEAILAELYQRGVQSVLVEGGAQTLQSFIDAGLWDDVYVETSHATLHSGVKAPKTPQNANI